MSSAIERDLRQLKILVRSGGLTGIPEKVDIVEAGFENYVEGLRRAGAAEVKLGLNESLGLSGSLRTAVHDIEG